MVKGSSYGQSEGEAVGWLSYDIQIRRDLERKGTTLARKKEVRSRYKERLCIYLAHAGKRVAVGDMPPCLQSSVDSSSFERQNGGGGLGACGCTQCQSWPPSNSPEISTMAIRVITGV